MQPNHSGKNSGNLEKRRDDQSEAPQDSSANVEASSAEEKIAGSLNESTQVDPHASAQTPEGKSSLPEFEMELGEDQAAPLPQRNQIGAIIDRKYELLSLLGTGGMSAVYKARHAFMRNIVAVKLMHPRLLSDTQSIKRFQQEARAAKRLKHPNAITVYEFGISGGQPFLVMDYLEGLSCADLIKKEGKIDLERCLNIFIQACDALADAHERGIIHRDLKPSNIMIVKENGDDCVKVVDFGIAKIVSEGGESLKLTNTGEVFGSPLYMSPEQCMGQTLDPRSDIYSMGCLMYEALTGKTPFTGKNVLETILKQTSEPPPGLGAIEGDVRVVQKLDAIVLKCLAKAPEQRYQSMKELKADLESAAQSAGSGWKPLANIGRKAAQVERSLARQMGRSHKSEVVVFAGSALAILLAICAISTWLLWPVYGPEHDPSLQSRELRLKPIVFSRTTVVDASKAPLGKLAMSVMNNPAEAEGLIRSLYVIGNKFKNAGDYYKAVITYAKAREFIVRYKQEGTLLCAQIIISEAECRLLLGESDASVRGYCQYGLEWLRKSNAIESRDGLRLYVLIGRVCASMGEKDLARAAFDRVLYLLGRVWQDCSDEDLAFAQSYAADFYRRTGNSEQARILYNNAFVHWQSLSRFDNALYDLGVVQSQLSSILCADRKFAEAQDYLNKANTNISEGGGGSIDKAKLEFLQSDLKLAQGKLIDYVVSRAQARKLWNRAGRNTGEALSTGQ